MESSFETRNSIKFNANVTQDIQRPPVYNAEDYAEYLRKNCKFNGLQLYLNPRTDIPKRSAKSKTLNKKLVNRDHLQENVKHQDEMGLKQFTSISELLKKLKEDLHLSYQSFLKEFISVPNNGVSLLLDLLKIIQLSQTNIAGINSNVDNQV